MYVRLGNLGQAETESQELQTSASHYTEVTTAENAAVAATAYIPIVGQVVAVLATIAKLFHIGEGCGAACIDSASTEQIFEAAGWNVELAGLAGQITQAQALTAIQWLLAQGETTMQALEKTDSKAQAGLANMTKSLNEQIQGVQTNSFTSSDFSGDAGPSAITSGAIPVSAPTATLDANELQASIFVQSGAKGYYPDAVASASSLALQAIAVATNQATTASTAATPTSGSGISATISGLFSSMGSGTLIALALAAGALFLFTGSGSSTKSNPRRKLRRKRVH
jgi:hypothetical protein